MSWETVIGLEIHAQLSTRSKIFSGASTAFGAEPNTQACAVDLGMPGVLPVLNRDVVRMAVTLGVALDASIAQRSVFARKNYFYPDLPKGYQISQMALPIVGPGSVNITTASGESKSIGVTRAHLEEDAGKSVHDQFPGATGIDLNRAGTPLLEIVSEPDLSSALEAVAYARYMHALVRWIGICDGNMQEGSFRCDANVSVRPVGSQTLGTRSEIKNLNSFRFLEQAIDFEVERQIDLLESGGQIVQETRLYDPDRDETRSMRSKEEANDYRYFPDPDLPPLIVEDAFIESIRAQMPELPAARQQRYVSKYGIAQKEAAALVADRITSDYFETMVSNPSATPKLSANWILGELFAKLNREEGTLSNCPVSATRLAELVARVADGTVSNKSGRQVLEAMWGTGDSADVVIEREGLVQISDSSALEAMVDEVIRANPGQVAEFRAGKEKLMAFFVGQVMRASKGKANPAQLNVLLKERLAVDE